MPDEHPVVSAVEAAVRRRDMIGLGETILVGVSGGPDSMALLHCLVALRNRWSLTLVVGHLNHGIRKEKADQEAAFVQHVASDLGLACKIYKRDVKSFSKDRGLSLQEGARKVRYRFYDQAAREYGAQKVALGHQADDNAESIMMHLLRGTGPRGLIGIPAVRDGWIIRPLVDVTRKEIMQFLRENGISCVEDPSNKDPRYLRNRIRHELFPVLETSYGFKAVPVLSRLAETMKEEEDFWQAHVDQVFRGALKLREADRIILSVHHLMGLHPALLHRCIRQAVGMLKGDAKGVERKHVIMVSGLLNEGARGGGFDLPQGVRVSRSPDLLVFSQGAQERFETFAHQIHGLGQTVIEELGLCISTSTCAPEDVVSRLRSFPPTIACLDLHALSFPLTVRNIKPGDRFVPLGMKGSQKVKDFFINEKVPVEERRRTPLIWSGDRLIWVAGYRIHEAVKLHKDTQQVLKLELLNG